MSGPDSDTYREGDCSLPRSSQEWSPCFLFFPHCFYISVASIDHFKELLSLYSHQYSRKVLFCGFLHLHRYLHVVSYHLPAHLVLTPFKMPVKAYGS